MPLTSIRNWYGKYERPISSLSLIGGFVFDALTLKRVDLFWENLWVIGHLLIVGACIVLIQAIEPKTEEGETVRAALAKAAANPSSLHFWLTNLQQFFYGGIWSTYLVFYFRSSDVWASWPFLALLALSFWANEALKRQFVRLTFQVTLYFLAIYCFAIFILPVILHRIGPGIFVLSGAASLALVSAFIWLIYRTSKNEIFGRKLMYVLIGAIFLVVNALYFIKVLPPIPLSLKDAGVYYSVLRNPDGNFETLGEENEWTNYFKLYQPFDYLPGKPVVVYSAVFAPNGLNLKIYHEWQKLDPKTGDWLTTDKVALKVSGGRDNGFRTFSQKLSGLSEGKWRVNIITSDGLTIGRVRFNLTAAKDLPKVIQETKF